MKSLSRVQLFATPWTSAYHAPLSMGFSRQEYWSGVPDSIPRLGNSPGERIGYPLQLFLAFTGGSAGKESTCNAGDLGLIPGLERSPGKRKGYALQYSCLENPMDGGAWWAAVHGVTKSWTRLSDFTFTFHFHALEKEMATHSSVLAWRIPGTGEPAGLPSMLGLHRVGHD